ncbi:MULTISPECIES: hypothetical protein [Bacillaceae]|uniref:hypothetical protein n=1 Tax=Bacillaceae TaxID=186817 RepID=UPI000C75E5CB|nr:MULTISPECIES: hypothetical protein [Bacillaceae]PLR66084.1 hypothetical protein CYJ36_20700 [Bacillus sp. UMB0893]QNG60690.1 hypothetical protein H4O14_04030 [Bacillus sp. PAMC26568]
MNVKASYINLKYFFDCYYNQSYDDSLDVRFKDFIELENDSLIQKLKGEILQLEQVYIQKDLETWKRIEELVHDDSLRYLPYSFGEEFIRTAKKILN